VRSGGMVVKNVAGLDMGKLMIGSFGTLAAIATLNFKLLPIPTVSRTLLFPFEDLKAGAALYEAVMKANLNPLAADALNPILSAQFSLKNFILALQFGGNQAVIERSVRESMALSPDPENVRGLSSEEEQRFWTGIAAITPRHLEKFRDGVVARISVPISESFNALATVEGAGHTMAASGIVRAWFSRPDGASRWLQTCLKRGWKGVIEFAGENVDRGNLNLWPTPGSDFEIMKGVKKMFDPEGLLNRGRLFKLI
jgi:glycolate oxidase FAD binding subunit